MTFKKLEVPAERANASTHFRDSGEREAGRAADAVSEPLAAVAKALEGMRYGAIHLIVHDGKAVQLEVTERRRFNA